MRLPFGEFALVLRREIQDCETRSSLSDDIHNVNMSYTNYQDALLSRNAMLVAQPVLRQFKMPISVGRTAGPKWESIQRLNGENRAVIASSADNKRGFAAWRRPSQTCFRFMAALTQLPARSYCARAAGGSMTTDGAVDRLRLPWGLCENAGRGGFWPAAQPLCCSHRIRVAKAEDASTRTIGQ